MHREPSRMKRVARAGGLLLALGLSGCMNDLGRDGTADVFIRIIDINGGAPYFSFVGDPLEGTLGPDIAPVTVVARSKNPAQTAEHYPRALLLDRYEIRYYRSDGRNVEGVDVPFRISGDMATTVEIAEAGETITIEMEIVRSQAKLEPPLRNLRDGGGNMVLTVFAEVTIYARTIASNDVTKAVARMQINFSGDLTQLPR